MADSVTTSLRARVVTLHENPAIPAPPGAVPGEFPKELYVYFRVREERQR